MVTFMLTLQYNISREGYIMEDCGCRNNEVNAYQIASIIISIVVGIAVGILFFLGLIPVVLNLIRIAITMSVIVIAIVLFCLFATNIIRGINPFRKCTCKFARITFAGAMGTFLAATIAAIVGVTIITPIAIIFVALTALFFTLMIFSIIGLYTCLIEQTNRGII